MQKFYVNGNL